MPTTKKRINITLSKAAEKAIAELAYALNEFMLGNF